MKISLGGILAILCTASTAFGVLGLAWMLLQSMRRPAAVKVAGDAPLWMRGRRWASGTIFEDRGQALGLWFATVITNAFSIAMMIDYQKPHGRHNAPFFVLVIPMVGLVLACCAIYDAVRQLKYGRSVLKLAALPGQIGGQLVGTVFTAKPLLQTTGLRITLACINEVTSGSGKSRMTRLITRWQDSFIVTGQLANNLLSTPIPIRFDIPADAASTDKSDRNNMIFWRLTLRAPEPGINYYASFIVPVFACDAPKEISGMPATAASARIERVTADTAFPEERGITIARDASGGMTIRFASLRRPGVAVAMALCSVTFLVLWVSAAALEYSLLLVIPLAIVDALFVVGLCKALFLFVVLKLDQHELLATRSMLRTRTTEFGREKIHAINAELNSTAGNSQFFRLALSTPDGKTYTLVDGLTALDAQWLQRELATRFDLPVNNPATFTHAS